MRKIIAMKNFRYHFFTLIMKLKKNYHFLLIALTFIACNSKVKKDVKNEQDILIEELVSIVKGETELVETVNQDSKNEFKAIWQNLPLKQTPVVNTTNFDENTNAESFNAEKIKALQLNEIYPNIFNEDHSFIIIPSYKLELSNNFYTIVLNVFKGSFELEAVLINYNLDEELIDYKIIAYDEIADGWAQTKSITDPISITTIATHYEDDKMDTIKFHINKDGYLNKIKTAFSSQLRPNQAIALNNIYTDTIEFSSYNDDGDYFLLFGKKNDTEVAFIYKWEWYKNDKYNFKDGDIIKVRKMDSIFLAGDGETLDFREMAIDAQGIISENKSVKFLWREDKFDESLNQTFYSIAINKSFTNTMSDQEKAALGYVASFIGNECDWDGKANEDRSNLKCEILTALNLGYQCSETHKGFLKQWFAKDSVTLKKLKTCVTIPFTATSQSTFDEIIITTNTVENTISINYKASSVNMRESKGWDWTQTDNFEYDMENIKLISSQKSEVIEKEFKIEE